MGLRLGRLCCCPTNPGRRDALVPPPITDPYDILDQCANPQPFHLMGLHPARISRVIDGDTVEVKMRPEWLGGLPRLFTIRLAGTDAPELHPKNKPADETKREILAAELSKLALQNKLTNPLGEPLVVEILERRALPGGSGTSGPQRFTRKNKLGFDKYGGRYVGNLWLGDEDVNAWMVDHGHAVPYDGGAKAKRDY